MNTLVVYDSHFGNTERIAKAIAEKMAPDGTARLVSADVGTLDLTGINLLFVGGPTQIHGVSPALRTLLDQLPAHALDSVLAAAFDTRLQGMKLLTGSAADGIAHRLEHKGARLLYPTASFLVHGSEGPLADGEVARACAWAVEIQEQAAYQLVGAV